MSLSTRVLVVAVVLLAVFAVKQQLRAHLRTAPESAPNDLRRSLSQIPRTLGDWVGNDAPIPEDWRFGDEAVWRNYRHRETGRVISFWGVFSRTGADRFHHPEVCYQVAGKPELESHRGQVDVAGHRAPIQRFCFGDTFDANWVYYWHYTQPVKRLESESFLQNVFRTAYQPPSSVTFEVFANQMSEDEVGDVEEFLRLVDAAIQDCLDPEAVRGSERMPVTVIWGDPLKTNLE